MSLIALTLVTATTLPAAKDEPKIPMPPIELRAKGGEYGPEKWTWEGVAIVADPINHQTLYLGGRCGGAETGTLGDWALDDDGKTWRPLSFKNDKLDPLRKSMLEARSAMRDAEAAARNAFYASMTSEEEAEALQTPAKLMKEAIELALRVQAVEDSNKPPGPNTTAVLRAQEMSGPSVDLARTVQLAFAAGKVTPQLLKDCFDAQWALDEAADCLASSPTPRVGAFVAYDPNQKIIVLFGGSHGDYVMNDTWIYDCTKKSWHQIWPKDAPSPRAAAVVPAVPSGKVELPKPVMKYDPATKRITLNGGFGMLEKMVYQQGFAALANDAWTFDTAAAQWTAVNQSGNKEAAPSSRIYRTVVSAYDPRWFDAAPRGDAEQTGKWLSELKPNVWTKVPIPERPAAERDWGTARYDPDRDQIYRWTGGHQADPSNGMTTYHPGINRYSIGYIPEIYGKGISFNGRPDCLNHTYLHTDYDPLSKRLICTSMAGTGVYNPDRRDWDYTIAQPFNQHVYLTCTVSTPKGVVVWTPGFFGIMNVKARAWEKLPLTGKLPSSMTDGSALTYDAQHDCIWISSHTNYQKPAGQIWKYDMKSGEVKAMDPAGRGVFPESKGVREMRECAYLPKLDLVLFNNFINDRELAYEPAKNRWVLLNIPKTLERMGTVSDTLVYDSKRDLVWDLNSYKAVYVIKVDGASLERTAAGE